MSCHLLPMLLRAGRRLSPWSPGLLDLPGNGGLALFLCLALVWTCGCSGVGQPPASPGTQPLPTVLPPVAARPLPELPPPAPPVAQRPPRVVISEVFADPLLLDDAAGEFVELANLSAQPVRLADLAIHLPSGKVAIPERPSAPLLSLIHI